MPTLTSRIKGHHTSGLLLILFICLGCPLRAQVPQQFPDTRENEKRMPDGRLQSEALLKADHESNLKDLDQMKKLMDAVRADLDKNDRHVLSIQSLKNLEEIEKLSKKIRDRMRRY